MHFRGQPGLIDKALGSVQLHNTGVDLGKLFLVDGAVKTSDMVLVAADTNFANALYTVILRVQRCHQSRSTLLHRF